MLDNLEMKQRHWVQKVFHPKQDKTKPQSILFKDYGERYLEEVIKKDRKDPTA